MPVISVVVAHRERTRRAACLRLLRAEEQIRVVGEARDRRQAIEAAKLKPRVLLLDFRVFREDGGDLLRVFRVYSPRTRVILLTNRAPEARILDALALGVRGFLEQRVLRTFLPRAVIVVDAGEAWVPRKMVAKIIDRLARASARVAMRR